MGWMIEAVFEANIQNLSEAIMGEERVIAWYAGPGNDEGCPILKSAASRVAFTLKTKRSLV